MVDWARTAEKQRYKQHRTGIIQEDDDELEVVEEQQPDDVGAMGLSGVWLVVVLLKLTQLNYRLLLYR